MSMTLPNHTTFQNLLQMPVGDVVALPAEQLALLQQDIEENLRCIFRRATRWNSRRMATRSDATVM